MLALSRVGACSFALNSKRGLEGCEFIGCSLAGTSAYNLLAISVLQSPTDHQNNEWINGGSHRALIHARRSRSSQLELIQDT